MIENWLSKAQLSFNVKNEKRKVNIPQNCSVIDGCDWESSLSVKIGKDWQPGYYIAKSRDSQGKAVEIPFVVQSSQEGARHLMVYDLNYFFSKNKYSGQSIDDYETLEVESEDYQLSLKRPWLTVFKNEEQYERIPFFKVAPFYKALKTVHPGVEVISNTSLSSKTLEELQKFQFITFVGDHQYLDRGLVERVNQYVQSGGVLWLAGHRFAQKEIEFDANGERLKLKKSSLVNPLFKELEFKSAGLTVVNEKHPLVDKIDIQKWGKVKGWSLSVPLMFPFSRVCIDHPLANCDNSEIIAYASIKDEAGENFYSPLTLIKNGQGKVIYTPKNFFNDNERVIEQFIKNLNSVSL